MRSSEAWVRSKFSNWIEDLSDEQLTALIENWDNVMGDAAIERINSWVIMKNVLRGLRSDD